MNEGEILQIILLANFHLARCGLDDIALSFSELAESMEGFGDD